MAEQHCATADEWACVEDHKYRTTFSCLLELRDRIEALEAAQQAKPNHTEKSDSSLVEQVANAMDGGTEWQARAAIRAVAAWLRKEFPYGARGWAMRLDREAKQ